MTIQATTPDYRGIYHFSPAKHWMNDPNGMVFFDGEYHLFFQHHPFGTTWGPMHWGHAVTRNLIDWEELPVAIEPDEHGTIFSGSAVVDTHNTTGFFPDGPGLIAIFTHHLERPGMPTVQTQSLAYSRDKGRTWNKYEGNPVLKREGWPDFRDPKVFWHEQTRQWIMVLACGQIVSFYRSPNLKNWTFGSDFGDGIGSHDGVWECPDLFELPVDGDPSNSRWVLLVSIGDNGSGKEGSRTQYFTGDFDGETFMPDEASSEVRWLDHGRDNYAGVSWSDMPAEDGRRLYVGWMSNWRYANSTPTDGWRGAMTLPRELTLETVCGVETLMQRPAREVEAARVPVLELQNVSLSELRGALKPLRLDAFELEVQAQAGQSFGFRLREGERCGTSVGFDADANELYIDRSEAGESDFYEHFADRHSARTSVPSASAQKARSESETSEASGQAYAAVASDTCLRIFVDRSSVEAFEGDGRLAMTDLIFPEPEADRLSAFGDEDGMVFRTVAIRKIQSSAGFVPENGAVSETANCKPVSKED
ncbi:glycoside hydrolase family 32 protein [Saccharibacillus sacchari]|uniref:glycoside hydrolase family 32 protein n=1 Tax=Saccharibacillus sacchari TaxID=456493 RepID=UPI0004AFE095|nr:glycoside hydrolase family 32 protein [Saccharibacillus sacchari]